jgi:hypothetical protein
MGRKLSSEKLELTADDPSKADVPARRQSRDRSDEIDPSQTSQRGQPRAASSGFSSGNRLRPCEFSPLAEALLAHLERAGYQIMKVQRDTSVKPLNFAE